ncbi:cytochrome P450 [Microbaculum marinisediminis]|uniref:Cytochrome P450 n=1 Tax=Microbaculum marinisediminis TaxID=2931392 RepID=A0AAW5R2W9_9HYPH|nr:cytochrome P450 [Microbaculum sp. A6E488]MCT8972890.1 cytochrome P450 [Microbaculum sp. A6E488]
MRLPRFDPFTDAFRAAPDAAYSAYRRAAAVHWGKSPATRARGAWYVFDTDLVRHVLRDPAFGRETHRGKQTGKSTARDIGRGPVAAPPLSSVIDNWVMFRDPPVHTRLRSVLSEALRRERVETWRTDCRRLADDHAAAAGAMPVFDLVSDYAVPYAAAVIGLVVGLPATDGRCLAETAAPISRLLDFHPAPGVQPAAASAIQTMTRYLTDRWEQSDGAASATLLSALRAATSEGRCSIREAIHSLILLVATGQATLGNLVINAASCLLMHPDQLAALAADQATPERAIEETLRFESPVQFAGRVVLDETRVGGHRFNRGDLVLCALGAVNRDPAATDDADVFRLDRDRFRHQSFGGGIHACVGVNLARMAGAEAIRALAPILANRTAAWPQRPWRELALFRARTRLDLHRPCAAASRLPAMCPAHDQEPERSA